MRTGGAPGAFLHSPTTIGCPAVGYIFAGTPILSSEPFTHSAARLVSALCSDFALTLGIRRNSNSSSWIRESFLRRKSSRSEGIVPLVVAAVLEFFMFEDSLAPSSSSKRCDQQAGSPIARDDAGRRHPRKSRRDTQQDAARNVRRGASVLAALDKSHRLYAEGRKSGESTAESYDEQTTPLSGCLHVEEKPRQNAN